MHGINFAGEGQFFWNDKVWLWHRILGLHNPNMLFASGIYFLRCTLVFIADFEGDMSLAKDSRHT